MTTPGTLRPSSAPRWAHCAGSFAMEATYPEDETEDSRAGTAAHWYVTGTVSGRPPTPGAVAPNGVPIDDEMREAGATFIAFALSLPLPRWVERTVTMAATLHPDVAGTPDLYVVDHTTNTLHVADYKYGHRYVDPFENDQLLCYVAGVCEAEGLTRERFKGWRVNLTIVQPRNYHPSGPVRTWSLLGHEAWRHFERIQEAAHAAKSPDAGTVTGSQCRDCSARHACPTLRRVGAYAMDLAGERIPQELPPEAMGLQLAMLRKAIARLEAQQSGLEEVAAARIRAGERVPGWGLKQGMGREKWTIPAEEVVTMGELLGVTLAKPATLTPNQARAAGMNPDVVKQFSTVPFGELKLTEVSDADVRKIFG